MCQCLSVMAESSSVLSPWGNGGVPAPKRSCLVVIPVSMIVGHVLMFTEAAASLERRILMRC